MSRRALALIVVPVLAASLSIAAESPDSISTDRVPTALDPVSGAPVPLDPARGPMGVMFLATWCRPCLAELPKLADLEDRWKPDGFRLFLVAVSTRQTAERLRELTSKETVPGKLLLDSDGSVAAAFGASTLPLHVLVDRRGHIVARSGALDPPFTTAVERLVRQEGRSQP